MWWRALLGSELLFRVFTRISRIFYKTPCRLGAAPTADASPASPVRNDKSTLLIEPAFELHPLGKAINPMIGWEAMLSHSEAVAAFCVNM